MADMDDKKMIIDDSKTQDKGCIMEALLITKEYGSSLLIPMLQKTQTIHGYLPESGLEQISEQLQLPLSRIYGVATFYSQFRFEPQGKHIVKVCHGTACHVNNATNISQALVEELGISEGETSEDGFVTLDRVACLGCCSLAPVIMIDNKVYGKLSVDDVRDLAKKLLRGELE